MVARFLRWIFVLISGLALSCLAHPLINDYSGSDGDSNGLLAALAIALSSHGYIYVSDAGAGLLYRMDDMEGTGLINYNGSALGTPFSSPGGVTTDSLGRIYVASGNHIYRFDDMFGTNQVEYDGSAGSTPFAATRAVFVDSQFKIYVTDNNTDTLYRFDDMSGFNQTEVKGVFNNPQGLAVDSSGNVYVADTAFGTIQRFIGMTTSGSTTYNGSAGTTFSNPFNVALDSNGKIYVASIANGLYVFDDMSGTNQTQNNVSASGLSRGLAVDSLGRIYYSEFTQNNRIYRFDDINGTNATFFGGPFSQPIYMHVSGI